MSGTLVAKLRTSALRQSLAARGLKAPGGRLFAGGGSGSRHGAAALAAAAATAAAAAVALSAGPGPAARCEASQTKGGKAQEERRRVLEVLAAAKATIEASDKAFLVTFDDRGFPHGRLVRACDIEGGAAFEVCWLGTNVWSRKVEDIRADARCCLLYWDREGMGYVSLSGRAELVELSGPRAPPNAAALREAHWPKGENWEMFFANGGASDPRFALLRFVPETMEMVSVGQNIEADPNAWRPAILARPPPSSASSAGGAAAARARGGASDGGWRFATPLEAGALEKLRGGLGIDGEPSAAGAE